MPLIVAFMWVLKAVSLYLVKVLYYSSINIQSPLNGTKTMTPDALMKYSYRLQDMDVRVIMSRLAIKLGCQKMEIFLISQVDYALKRKLQIGDFFFNQYENCLTETVQDRSNIKKTCKTGRINFIPTIALLRVASVDFFLLLLLLVYFCYCYPCLLFIVLLSV